MDKPIEKKTWTAGRIVLIVCSLLIIVSTAYLFAVRPEGSRLKVDSSRITFSKVGYGEFREYYPFDARVEPVTSVYLDVETGGRVEQIFVEDGKYVKKGELILRFSNANLQRNSIDTETRLLENLNIQRTTQLQLEQNKLMLKESLLQLNHQILDAERKYRRYRDLGEESGLVSGEDYQLARDELTYLKNRRDLLEQRIEQEERLSQIQLDQSNISIERLNISRDLLERTVESLDVKAPISGYISSIDAQIGQNISAGSRIGQIDLLDELKLCAGIDQYYISRVEKGTSGRFRLDDENYEVEVQKIYPEVREDSFDVDLAFLGEMPKGIRRGQTITVELDFSESRKSLLVSKGGFYSQTSGRWVYLIAVDRQSAHRVDIRTGRQNPQHVEVLEGLRDGDWIITSGYDAFNEVDILLFPEPVQLGG